MLKFIVLKKNCFGLGILSTIQIEIGKTCGAEGNFEISRNNFLNLIYIKLTKDRQIKIVPLNRAGESTQISFFRDLEICHFS